jgi:hypothetical protein
VVLPPLLYAASEGCRGVMLAVAAGARPGGGPVLVGGRGRGRGRAVAASGKHGVRARRGAGQLDRWRSALDGGSLPPKVRALVQAEGLFNDDSLVLFRSRSPSRRENSRTTPGGVLLHGAGGRDPGGSGAAGRRASRPGSSGAFAADPVLETHSRSSPLPRTCWARRARRR